jgi:hypothetical protein
MEDIKKKLGYYSFAQLSWEELDKGLHLLRNVKYRFCKCSENCYSQPEVAFNDWKRIRGDCIQRCQQAHDKIFQVFYKEFTAPRDQCLSCVLECGSEYPISKYGEEDMKICEEKCYESLLQKIVDLNSQLNSSYQSIYLEKFKYT